VRVPSDVLDRVRGALVVAALASCSHEAKAPPPPATPATADIAPAPVDPVRYASADEADRLARLDAEEAAGVAARRARLDRLAAQRREAAWEDEQQREILGLGTVLGNGTPLTRFSCNACGRG
jgi:hypothetical protein